MEPKEKQKVIVYVDGFNFYYGLKQSLKWKKYYWLDVVKLFETFMLPYFLGGALMYQLRERIPMRPWLALIATAGSVALILSLPGFGAQLASPLIAYVIL